MNNDGRSRRRPVGGNELIDLNHVRAFIRVVEDGSFTAAGRNLALPKSSVSRGVTALEQSLGVRLLQRNTRAVRLTDSGSTYYQQVREAMERLHESTASLRAMGTEPRGRVRISCPPDLHEFIADFVAKFGKRHPQVQVEASFSTRYVDLVAEGYDLAVRAGPLQDSPLVVRRVTNARMGLFAAPAYLAKRGTPQTLADLAGHDAIALAKRSEPVRWTLLDSEGREESVELRCSVSTDLLMFTFSAAEQGLGLALLPVILAGKLVEAGKLVRVLPEWKRNGLALSVVSPSRAFEPLAVRLFKQELIDGLTLRYERWS